MVDAEGTDHNVEVGNWVIADWSSRSVPIPCAPWRMDWSSGAAEPRPRPFIRRKGEGRRPLVLQRSYPPPRLLSSLHHGERACWCSDGGDEGLRSTVCPSFLRAHGGGAGHDRKREGARPRLPWHSGRRRTVRAPASPPPMALPPMEGHV